MCITISRKVLENHLSVFDAVLSTLKTWIVSGPGGALWYVHTVLIMLLILAISNSDIYRRTLFITLGMLSFLPTFAIYFNNNPWVKNITEAYTFVFENDRNILFYGVYLAIGLTLSLSKSLSLSKNVIAVMFSLLLISYFATARSENLSAQIIFHISKVLIISCIFYILYSATAYCYSYNFSVKMRKMSTIIYFSHVLAKLLIQAGFSLIKIPITYTMLFVICATVLTTYSIIITETKKGNIIFNLLY